MFKDEYLILGAMSGTSLDGLDLAAVRFYKENGQWHFQFQTACTIPYPDYWLHKLKNVSLLQPNEVNELDHEYSHWLGTTMKEYISRHSLHSIDAVCSHGHTAWHQPEKGITLQIGNQNEIASIIKKPVVCNFRKQDITLGGQGAPLVPVGDALLFQNFDYCLNLGGFSNISYEDNGKRIAFDICPVNTVLNHFANTLKLPFDDKGAIASKGQINQKLLDKLNALAYYRQTPPKSLGIEWVQSEILPLINHFSSLKIPDILCTFTEHIAIQISKVLDKPNSTMLITGGGAYNDFLISRLKFHAKEISIIIPDDMLIQFKEALIFGFLGVLKLRGENNIWSSVTGAEKDHSSGDILT